MSTFIYQSWSSFIDLNYKLYYGQFVHLKADLSAKRKLIAVAILFAFSVIEFK